MTQQIAFQAHAVARKGQPDMQLDLIYFGDDQESARARIRDAIASGYDYGYIKQGTMTVGWFNEASFLPRSNRPARRRQVGSQR